MKLFIIVLIASFGVIGVFSEWERRRGGSAGGLLEGGLREGLGGGGYHSRGSIIGLSRGIELGGYGRGGEEEGGGGSGGGGGGGYEEEEEGGRGGGGGGGGGGGEERGGGGEERGRRWRGEIGWGGSKFITPVDVHHEEVIHLKARPEYHYDYHVADHRTKDFKSKHEVRDGYKVRGTYSLLEPDHKTIRVVDYRSDKKRGFVARVSWRKHRD